MAVLKLFESDKHTITEVRKNQLKELALKLSEILKKEGALHINFICTHNSRRSQLAEVLLFLIAREKGMDNIFTYSGGTEATAFNPRMVAALSALGINFHKMGSDDNPLYRLSKNGEDHYCFSKVFDHELNPKEWAVAITVCSDADQNCPHIPSAQLRFHLGYIDPKASDDTPQESETYKQKVFEVGTEMLHLVKSLDI